MGTILISIFVFGLISFIDGRNVFKSKDFKKIGTYSFIFLAASILSTLLIVGIKIPNPMEPVKDLIVSIFGKD